MIDATVLEWARRAIGTEAKVLAVEALRSGGSRSLLRIDLGGRTLEAVLKNGSIGMREELATEAAALSLAEKCGIATPRLLATDLDGDEAGNPAVLFTALEGQAHIPRVATVERLRALGAAAAELHRFPLAPSAELPLRTRHMPWIDFAGMRRSPAADEPPEASTPLLDAADALVSAQRPPDDETVFVHGDLWQGNTMWVGDRYTGMIDWEAAGAGSYGVDLGSLRLDTALLHDLPATDQVLAGWERASGRPAENVAYWDIVAALNTQADMTGFLPAIHDAGRVDLDGSLLTHRRDAFLRAAVDRIEV